MLALNASQSGLRLVGKLTPIGPPVAWYGEPAYSGLCSERRKYGSRSAYDQPGLPIAAQSSKSLAGPRKYAMPLIDPVPPITRPRGSGTRRPFKAGWGTVERPQPNFGLMIAHPTAAGTAMNGWRFEPPASIKHTRLRVSSDRRAASTDRKSVV